MTGDAAAPSTHTSAGENNTPSAISNATAWERHCRWATGRAAAIQASITAPPSISDWRRGSAPGVPIGHRTHAISVAHVPAIASIVSAATDIRGNEASSARVTSTSIIVLSGFLDGQDQVL